MASRLASQLGGTTLSKWLVRRAWRQKPDHGRARCYYAYHLSMRRGPYAAWRWMHHTDEPSEESDRTLKADWYALLGQLAAMLRDFDAADRWIQRARDVAPSHPWIDVCGSAALECEDLYEESLNAARRALELQPWYCPALQRAGHLLTLLGRDAEAVQLLTDALKHVESCHLACQLHAIHFELGQYEQALAILERCMILAPLAERPFRRWWAAQRSDVAYHLGDHDGAIRYARQVGHGFHEHIASRLDGGVAFSARSRILPVGFVRQHQMTCGPATLSAISRYWTRPANHVEIAEDICYNGTPAHSERTWAETHGWLVREFTVTESSAVALVDRGVPFTLTTIDPANAHLQAVIGYDERRATLWIRDPFQRHKKEAIAATLLEHYGAFGPRGMALVPVSERARLEGLDLPDAPLWDLLHELNGALIAHQRETAAMIHSRMRATADRQRLTFMARLHLAQYDDNRVEQLAAVEQLLELSPADPCLELRRLIIMRDFACRDERIAVYARLCGKRDVATIFLQQYAQELRADARWHGKAIALLTRAIRRSPYDAGNYRILADVLWDQRRFEEAFELYRFAMCLDDKNEAFADSYFRAARWFKRTEEA
ncbi:MAG: hypothetical protein GX621_18280, partial [Pirellulaceae bacterium]|nr:hypothetical protein [Pirellulaceae bacterium]